MYRINIHEERSDNSHRQTIQYLHPGDAAKLGQAELLVIDEAAAIPLPLVKSLLGPYLVFMSSTINGYEGTGRSLSLKLLDNLRQQSNPTVVKAQKDGDAAKTKAVASRSLREVTLEESIRYKPGDDVEAWLNKLLCLDAAAVNYISSGTPSKDECNLYYINRYFNQFWFGCRLHRDQFQGHTVLLPSGFGGLLAENHVVVRRLALQKHTQRLAVALGRSCPPPFLPPGPDPPRHPEFAGSAVRCSNLPGGRDFQEQHCSGFEQRKESSRRPDSMDDGTAIPG